MPGHKRNPFLATDLPYALDITEIDGAWDVHHPDASLRQRLQDVAKQCGAHRSFYMTNGSTGGLLAALYTLCTPGDALLMPRASHQSVYHAVELLNLRPTYLLSPQSDDLPMPPTPEAVEAALNAHPDIHTVIVTSPTYEGKVADIAAIAHLCHAHGARLIVDQAHGAHLRYFAPAWDAVHAGADIVVESLHKMLPALTPAALVHASSRVDAQQLAHALGIFETSSPSHVILASMDLCLRWLAAEGAAAHTRHIETWQNAKARWSAPDGLSCLQEIPTDDPFKVVLSTQQSASTGTELAWQLRESGYEVEMATPQSVLCLLSVADEAAMYSRFVADVLQIDAQMAKASSPKENISALTVVPRFAISMAEARRAPHISRALKEAVGHVAAETLWTYPPGIPLLLPGEVVDETLLASLSALAAQGIPLRTECFPEGRLSGLSLACLA